MSSYCMSCSDSWDCYWYCGLRVKGPIAVCTLHITQSCIHIKYMAHNPPHTHDELNKSFCNMKRNSTLKMRINCAPLPLVCVLVSIQIKSRPVWRSDKSTKSMQKICYRNYWIRWLQSKQFRFSQFLLIDLFSVQGLQCKSLSQAMMFSKFILICV